MDEKELQMSDEYRRRGWWRDETFLDDLRRATRSHPGKTAVVTYRSVDGSTHSFDYTRLTELTDRFAGAIVELGLRPGDVLGVQLTNRWELAPLSLACMRAGVLFCPLLPVYRRRELEVMLQITQARALVTMSEHNGDRLGELGTELAAQLPSLEHILVADGPGPSGTLEFESYFLETPWEERHSAQLDARELGADDPYMVLFTSGTTSEPKGVLHSQNTLHAAIRGEADVFSLDDSLVMMTIAAYTHYTGVVQGMFMPLMLGGTMAFLDSAEPGDALDLMARHRITFLYCSPPYLLSMLEAQKSAPRDLSALQWVVSGSAPIPPHFVEEVKKTFDRRLFSLWGMTENGPVTISRPDDPEDWAAHSDGSPISDMRLRIDPISEQSDSVGVLWTRGPTQCLGYYRRESLYAAQLDADGWFNTGDLARPDGRGGIRIAGRHKDMILRHAFIVPVADLEAIISRHPGVREAAIVGIPDQRGDETICAVVTSADPDVPVTLEELQRWLNDAGMTDLYWPDLLQVVDELPKTPTGKVRKVELKETFALQPRHP